MKGLSNNAIRRLDRHRSDARVGARSPASTTWRCCVELLTEGLARDERPARPDRGGAASRPVERRAAARSRLADRLAPAGRARSASPCPTSERSSRRPPSAVESSFAIASPSPVPPPTSRDERPEEPLARLLGDAGPGVLDRRRAPMPFRCASSSEIRPPSGVAWNAFESRLPTTCSTRSPSEVITGRSRTSLAVVDRRGAAPRRGSARTPGRGARPCRPPRVVTVKRCVSSFARSRMSPTSRSSRCASASTVSSEPAAELGIVDDAFEQRRDVPANRGQRRAQLVRDRHQEVALHRSTSASRPAISRSARSGGRARPARSSGTVTS